jgi:hypothetical protein
MRTWDNYNFKNNYWPNSLLTWAIQEMIYKELEDKYMILNILFPK